MRKIKLTNARGNKVANQYIIFDGYKTSFQSYQSLICTYDESTGKLRVYEDWDYSRTTLKYFYQFLREFTPFGVGHKQGFLNMCKKYPDRILFNDEEPKDEMGFSFEEFKEQYDQLSDRNKEIMKQCPHLETAKDANFAIGMMKFMNLMDKISK